MRRRRSNRSRCGRAAGHAALVLVLGIAYAGFCADRVTQEFDYAKALSEQGFYRLAQIVYQDAVAARPDHERVEEAVLAMALLKANMKQYDEALADYQAFLKKYGYSKLKADAEVGIAEIHFEQKNYDQAAEEFKKVLDASKDGASAAYVRAQYGQAWCLLEMGKNEEAAQAFKEFALVWQGTDREQEARLAQAECYMRLQQYDKALDAYNKARAKATTDDRMLRAMLGMARAHQGNKSYKQALLAYDAAIKRDPNSPLIPMAMTDKAECLAAGGDEDGAKKILEDIMTQYPGTPYYQAAMQKMAKIGAGGFDAFASEVQRYAVAQAEVEKGNYEAAITRYKNLLEKFPKGKFSAKAQYGIARCYAKMNDPKKAAEAFMAVAEKYPDDKIAVDSLRDAARAYGEAKDTTGKAAALKKLADLYPEAGKADAIMLQAAGTAFDDKDYKRAAQAFIELVEKYPKSPHCEAALFQGAYSFYLDQNFAEAEKTFARLLKDFPKSDRRADASYLRGESLYNLKRTADAIKELNACLTYGPTKAIEARAYFWIGVCQETDKKFDAALASYSKAATAGGEDAQFVPQARFRAALVCFQQKDAEKCVQRMLDLVKDFPTYPIPGHIMAWLADQLLRSGDHANAARVADLIITRYGSDKEQAASVERAYTIAGQAKMQIRQWQEALDTFTKLLELYPTSPQIGPAKLGIAECYKQLTKYDKAVAELQEVIPTAVGDLLMEAQGKLAETYEAQGDRENAVRVLKKALLLAPADLKDKGWLIRLNVRLGKLCEALGNKADALAAYRAADAVPTSDPEMAPLKKEAQEKIGALSGGQQ